MKIVAVTAGPAGISHTCIAVDITIEDEYRFSSLRVNKVPVADTIRNPDAVAVVAQLG